ncbi:DUF1924 domain-containing protein [bacterium]|nr:DUF1924 domain-containing protein [bacterium]
MKFISSILLSVAALVAQAPALAADTPASLQAGWLTEAQKTEPGFKGFSAARGETFFRNTHGSDWSCATCHTANPNQSGKHEVTGKLIQPLAPAANAERFSDSAKVEKWFRRNCNDVLKRACTPQEKGDVVAWLLSIK